MKQIMIVLLCLGVGIVGATERSASARYAFRKAHPCPATDKRTGACPGYIVDHIMPLCAGGADDPANMQWQTKEDALAKDKEEWKLCRSLGTM